MPLFIYLLISILLCWIYGGYIIFLTVAAKKNEGLQKNIDIPHFPKVEIIIPCYNEQDFIKNKIQNLLSLNYPTDRIHFTFVDGGSTDNTTTIIQRSLPKHDNIQLIQTNLRSKIKQINKILPSVKADIIGISDVDTQLASKTIKKIIRVFNSHQDIAVVGAQTQPKMTIPLDEIHWQTHNSLRLLESASVSSSSVIGNFYAFKRNLLERFPLDVVADDVYIAFLAQSKGLRVAYTGDLLALELRSPGSIQTFSKHKFRKAHARIRETLRFLAVGSHGRWSWKIVYFTNLLQVVGAPFLIIIFLSLTVYFLSSPIIPILIILLIISIAMVANQLLHRNFRLYNQHHRSSQYLSKKQPLPIQFGLFLTGFLFINLLLFSSLLVYPFYKQTASYRKIH